MDRKKMGIKIYGSIYTQQKEELWKTMRDGWYLVLPFSSHQLHLLSTSFDQIFYAVWKPKYCQLISPSHSVSHDQF